MTPALSVVIVNYNAGAHLERCLRSLVDHLGDVAWDALVVDNASSDGSDRIVERFAPLVSLLRNADNAGFARAVNQGMAATTGPLALFLNPDARLLPHAFDRMRAELAAHPGCAVVGPSVINDDGSAQGSARGDPSMLTGLFGRSTWLTRVLPGTRIARRNVKSHVALGPGEASVEVDWVSGSCMLVRREVFKSLGGFDEQFFLYWEDADLCRRIRQAGHRVRYCPDARVAHTAGRSSRTARATAVRAFHRSAYLYYKRHVAPAPWHPGRWMARFILGVRCWVLLRRAGDGAD